MQKFEKYSTFVKAVAASLTDKQPYICNQMRQFDELNPEHCATLRQYIRRKLKEEYKKRVTRDCMAVLANALYFIFVNRHGIDHSPLLARQLMLRRLAAYHESRGN